MAVLDNLEPKKVFKYFEEISAIPRGSGNTKEISDYIVSFARTRGLECYQDEANNVIVIKEASDGYRNAEPLIIQSHIDMVCEKESGIQKDMSVEPVELVIDGDLISAKGTTLGADDGIGVAYMLAILDDDSLSHPCIEAVFTSDEEIGMLGAFEVDASRLKGKKMLNLDGGDEKIFTVGCAGGITSKSIIPLSREDFSGTSLKISISGISGGHSGVMIGMGGANSNSLSGRLLNMLLQNVDFRLSHIEGGFKDNAIPVETNIVIVTPDKEKCMDIINTADSIFKNEYSVTDPSLNIIALECEYIRPFDKESTQKAAFMLNIAPNGVQKMSSHIEDLVETSLNFAILNCTSEGLEATFSVRSSVQSQKDMMVSRLSNLTTYLGGSVEISGDYPGWEFKSDSDFRNLASNVYRDTFGTEPKIEAVHAGLECGLFSGKIPGLDCICYGPNMWDIHTPKERISVTSVNRVWEFLKELISRM